MNKFFYQAKLYCLSEATYEALLIACSELRLTEYIEFMQTILKNDSSKINNCFYLMPETTISGERCLADIYLDELQHWQLSFSYDFSKHTYFLCFQRNIVSPPLTINSLKNTYFYDSFKASNKKENKMQNEICYPLQHGDLLQFNAKSLLFYCPK